MQRFGLPKLGLSWMLLFELVITGGWLRKEQGCGGAPWKAGQALVFFFCKKPAVVFSEGGDCDGRQGYAAVHECSCGDAGPHNRLTWFSNTRTKMEDLIVNHAVKGFKERMRMLSMGSGGCLQELVLAARLAEAGVRSIELVLVEPGKGYEKSCKDLIYFLGKMREAYRMERLSCKRYKLVTDVRAEEPFDVVYAMDYDDYSVGLDYPKLEGRFDREKEPFLSSGNPYFAAVDLIKAANLAIRMENALVVMSYKSNMISLTPRVWRSRLVELKNLQLSRLDYDLFYLSADISNLLVNLEYFMEAKKPLLINRAILREEDMDSIGVFLERHGVSCEFVDDATAFGRLENGLVVDCSGFGSRRGENKGFIN